MEGERARRGGLGNPYDEQHASAESDQIDEQREQLQFGQHIQILAVPRIPQMIFANGANPLHAFIQPPRRQTSPLLPEELCEKRGVLAPDEIPISLGKNGVAEEWQVTAGGKLGLSVRQTNLGFFPNGQAILGPQKMKRSPHEDGGQNEK
jgi:hypothetical protein